MVEALTPASPDNLPPLGQMPADELFWRYRRGTAGEGAVHLRVWLTTDRERSHLAVVTDTGAAAGVTESAGHIWAGLARPYWPSLMLPGHRPPPEAGDGAETLDLVRIGADGSPHWLRVWPAPEGHPPHAGLERWMAVTGTGSSASSRAGSSDASSRAADPAQAGLGGRSQGDRSADGCLLMQIAASFSMQAAPGISGVARAPGASGP